MGPLSKCDRIFFYLTIEDVTYETFPIILRSCSTIDKNGLGEFLISYSYDMSLYIAQLFKVIFLSLFLYLVSMHLTNCWMHASSTSWKHNWYKWLFNSSDHVFLRDKWFVIWSVIRIYYWLLLWGVIFTWQEGPDYALLCHVSYFCHIRHAINNMPSSKCQIKCNRSSKHFAT